MMLWKKKGFVITIHGKGSFVAFADQGLMLEEKKKEVEADLEMAIRKGQKLWNDGSGITGVVSRLFWRIDKYVEI